MVPDTRKKLEVAGAVLGHAGGPEEGDGLRGEGARADEVAGGRVGDGVPSGGVGGEGHGEGFLLDFAGEDGGEGGGGAEE